MVTVSIACLFYWLYYLSAKTVQQFGYARGLPLQTLTVVTPFQEVCTTYSAGTNA